ncbi:MAG: fructosamine kinase family protein [gamma proteobacterium symbiont of Lucinoma myriamae]|nr:fructosamine kinase family protein [gamma proteobacterium symbiont of Lucinoma myriamae]MCU7817805.1 fructosamine kinase family protein [gamma proteobacterium symbiont of Lucinoma myriamae]MCU7833094.1 fructosamine kinase family protein [gamma proteobacterium symbiont of Lucinoma myriamae]
MTYWQHISDHISQTINKPFQIRQKKGIGGGSINSAYQVTGNDGQQYFIKLNSASLEFMFQVEFDSLNELLQVDMIQIPRPVCFGTAESKSYLVLEYIAMKSSGDQQQLGYALAQMHKISASQYGWYQNNIIGSTPQRNNKHSDWLTFWREERLLPQVNMLYDKGYKKQLQTLSDKLLNNLDTLLANHNPAASLLHGDLWAGNYAFDDQGRPVIFDPALYYGDREADLAMTELFGGFSQNFYQAYNEAWPLDNNYNQRKTLYNLYHILNHANLFGSSYLNQAISMMQKLC